ncbi:hypothetical protein TM7_0666 [candidate division TM7 genomosp. GTL1]|nr:hypothetical protein TM7_0666 [candidate division TM7 genomosp. GTL1]
MEDSDDPVDRSGSLLELLELLLTSLARGSENLLNLSKTSLDTCRFVLHLDPLPRKETDLLYNGASNSPIYRSPAEPKGLQQLNSKTCSHWDEPQCEHVIFRPRSASWP